ncbi:penicillin-binding protein 2 [Parasaccharibacter sp. TMW2.1882]|uniref:Penicillin-binding protein 2 n=1 Tax=Bombella apis TaxID=1785988 RepID=A0ABR9MNW8_9PROT|nr:penicillin-binding protein 2 [Bombella apis]MCK8636930.1 penicillin-binding protein 2 [Parasaccharibacter sp. TMW2.1885]MCL1495958.1 penicillin-binding protein 2 [Parasaccharibacter sp. TMW2.1882]MCL1511534.1 penicillin-binding protein 2 [Parasaccharibacter sp. TMW 2.1884]MCL1515128.1 penicillin-binding protein 2 [Parasaccharibacter sp. TMW2.1890]MCL1562896.1 penicillin-binding protein 2 [Parasaccharibacter sp. TMW 2.1886]MUG79639.1 penicillin-binding protein 2 [Bombella sp. ESL0380]MUH02
MASRPSRKTNQPGSDHKDGPPGKPSLLRRLWARWDERRRNPMSWLEKSRNRLVYLGMGFLFLYGGVAIKALFATILAPMAPLPNQVGSTIPDIPHPDPKAMAGNGFVLPNIRRASIVDRNGQPLALSLPVVQVYANPMEIIEPEDVARSLHTILPNLNMAETIRRLKQKKQFVYLARNIAPTDELAINNLGIPGIYFENGEQRHYPLGNVAAQILGSVDIDNHGIAGVEKFFNQRLLGDHAPLRLSIDARVQAAVRDELNDAKLRFRAIGASAILMDVHTGEILAMVSLPDYDANDFAHAADDARFNRAVTGMYEPGSTFKLQTAAMALELGVAHPWDQFSTIPIHVGRFKISDLKTDHFAPWLALPSVMAYSSNPASAHIALDVGRDRQHEWLKNMGFLDRVPVELPEAGRPLVPSLKNWGETTVMTVGFGHGVAESPLAIVRGTACTGNGGYLVTPTLLAREHLNDDVVMAEEQKGPHLISTKNSELLRRILRLVVTKGIGKKAESPGYIVGGKTGTAEKIGAHGGYLKHVNITAFTGMFPMNDPKYALYVMLDAPQGTAETHGWTTAGWIAAPTFSRIVTRTAPMLGLFPLEPTKAQQVDDQLALSLSPPVPPGVRHPLGPGNDPGAVTVNRLATKHGAHHSH